MRAFANYNVPAGDYVLRKTESGNSISPTEGVVGSKFNQQRWKASTPFGKTQFTELPQSDLVSNQELGQENDGLL